MLYLTGASNAKVRAAAQDRADLGLLIQPKTKSYRSHAPDYSGWACDNGAFSPSGNPVPTPVWWAWLSTLDADGCLFATAPDAVVVMPDGAIFGDPVATWERSAPWLARIRALGIPAALVAQPGFEAMDHDWSAFDVVFLGGHDEWKLGEGGRATAELAKAHGKWLHMGRVNTARRIRYAAEIGCDSADGTTLRFTDANLPRVLGALDDVAAGVQGRLV